MQGEIDAAQTLREVHILGVNDIGLEAGNDAITAGRELPWLQPVGGQTIWILWEVTYRDVYIVGPGNELLDVYNLTEHNLADTANYDTLEQMLLDAANE